MAATELIDSLGVPLSQHHLWLPARTDDWPTPPKIVDKEACIEWKRSHYLTGGWRCWWCGWLPFPEWERKDDSHLRQLEGHHMARYDAPWAFALLCSTCHRTEEYAVKSLALPRLIRLKHEFDQRHTSWVHLALGLGRRLPDGDRQCAICGCELVFGECEVCSECTGGSAA